jgi:exosortase
MEGKRHIMAAWIIAGAGVLIAYSRVLASLVQAWWTDDNYSHGFLIVPVALYFLWERRARLGAAAQRPALIGFAVLGASLCVLAIGVLGAELFLTRMSLIGVLVGIILCLHGWPTLRLAAFPLAFLVLMVPLPAIIFNQIAFPLQLLASRAGEAALNAADIPVFREGNVLVLSNTSLEVAEACSGIRSLVSLVTLGIVVGYFGDRRGWIRTAVALSAVPVAIVANAARVAGTGIAAHYYGPAAAQGFFHEFSGWIVFVVSFSLLLAFQRLIIWAAPRVSAGPAIAAEAV